tara:strand:+ start:432 stop:641 length:210 start_codon:yes stop_codon:yes gene_type:complete
MNIEQIRDNIAEELGAVHEIISTILDSSPDEALEHNAIKCNDNTIALLEYARGFADSAFQCLDKLERYE